MVKVCWRGTSDALIIHAYMTKINLFKYCYRQILMVYCYLNLQIQLNFLCNLQLICNQRAKRWIPRDGDYADPHTSKESPRIMARRRGRCARRQTAPHLVSLLSTSPASMKLDRALACRHTVWRPSPLGTPTPPMPTAGGQDAKPVPTHTAAHLSHANKARTQS